MAPAYCLKYWKMVRGMGGGGVLNLVRLALHPGGAGVAKFIVAEFYLILCMS